MPGYSVKSYSTGESIPLFANKIFSDHTHLQYAYYELPFVCPPKGKKLGNSPFTSGTSMSLNLGEVLRGDRIKVSDFDIVMDRDIECAPLCTLALDRKTMRRLQALIADGYVAEYILDNLPGATAFVTLDGKKKYYSPGFKLGYEDLPERDDEETDAAKHPRTRTFLNNHLTFVIRWRKAPGKAGDAGKKVIVAFEIYTRSIENGPSTRAADGCPLHPAAEDVEPFLLHIPRNLTALLQEKGELDLGREDRSYTPPVDEDVEDGATLAVPYSYSVYFREDESIQWAKRWSMYNHGKEKAGSAHGCAIATSLVIAIAMGVWVGMIWRRTAGGHAAVKSVEEGKLRLLSRSPSPISGRGKGDDDGKGRAGLFDEDADEFSGWKLLHADVFRAPEYSGLFPPLVGSGTQFLFMFLGLLMLSLIGVLKPSYRGGFFSVGTGLFVFAGLFSGYYSGRLYKTFGGLSWRKNAIITALLFPGLSFALVFVINLFVWAQASSTAIPFGTLIVLLTLWLLIQLPLVYLGSYVGYLCVPAYDHPPKTSLIPPAEASIFSSRCLLCRVCCELRCL
ncbi:hypothetical protein KEM55_004401 [Ascosphaera atra]|nr:hypothetical protein KEM55_004401 [Ascosphaera atra]